MLVLTANSLLTTPQLEPITLVGAFCRVRFPISLRSSIVQFLPAFRVDFDTNRPYETGCASTQIRWARSTKPSFVARSPTPSV
jgi:hypothetical protein